MILTMGGMHTKSIAQKEKDDECAWKGGIAMEELFNVDGRTDEDLLREYSVSVEGRTFVPARLLDAIGRRHVQMADRKPGDPGTTENPIFKDGKAYVYSSRNQLIWWEDYDGPVPEETKEEHFILTIQMEPSPEQKRMIQKVKTTPVVITTDCPVISGETLAGMKRFSSGRPVAVK